MRKATGSILENMSLQSYTQNMEELKVGYIAFNSSNHSLRYGEQSRYSRL